MPDMNVGLTAEAAAAKLQAAGFAAKAVGGGDTVLTQYPEAGQTLPRGSTVLLYTSEDAARQVTVVPSAAGQTLAEATETLHAAGLNIKAAGAAGAEGAVAVGQSSPAGEQLPQGSLVTVTFYDYTVPEDGVVRLEGAVPGD